MPRAQAARPPFVSVAPATEPSRHRGDVGDTMQAWEQFLTGQSPEVVPACNFVVSSWQRSLALGVNPTGRAAPLSAQGEAMRLLRLRHRALMAAAAEVFSEMTELLAGSRSIMLLTNPDGVVLEVVGDLHTLDQGQDIHLMPGGDWSEGTVGTNGIGTALATGRPAQIHAAEHFCEGIKRWTCAAAPIYEPNSGTILGVVDISGPPTTYQRNNLALAAATAAQIEGVIAERTARERAQLLEACLRRLSSADAAGLVAIDRGGRLVHATGRVAAPVGMGERVPGLDPNLDVEKWAERLPGQWRAEWFNPVSFGGRNIGAMLVVPAASRPPATHPNFARPTAQGSAAQASPLQGSESDPARSGFDAIIGRSAPMAAMLDRARMLARHRVPVLIEGETGVGKELVARALHGGDARPFIAFNCGAASKELLAGDLFGHVRGAFTGATSEGRPGRFELAQGGTLCLDEIGEMPLDLQPVLLRVLEEGVVYRLGDTQPRRVDVRLVAITNRNLRAEVEAGRFRRDLFYRVNVTALAVPPLRDRGADIDLLVSHFSHQLAARHGVAARRFGPEALAALRARPWQGNVRELRNVVENLLLTNSDPVVAPREVAADGDEPARLPPIALAAPASLQAIEQDTIARAMQRTHGNIAGASRLLGISRSTLYRKLGISA